MIKNLYDEDGNIRIEMLEPFINVNRPADIIPSQID